MRGPSRWTGSCARFLRLVAFSTVACGQLTKMLRSRAALGEAGASGIGGGDRQTVPACAADWRPDRGRGSIRAGIAGEGAGWCWVGQPDVRRRHQGLSPADGTRAESLVSRGLVQNLLSRGPRQNLLSRGRASISSPARRAGTSSLAARPEFPLWRAGSELALLRAARTCSLAGCAARRRGIRSATARLAASAPAGDRPVPPEPGRAAARATLAQGLGCESCPGTCRALRGVLSVTGRPAASRCALRRGRAGCGWWVRRLATTARIDR